MTTKIELFKLAKETVARIRKDVAKCLGRDSSRNDKHRAAIRYVGLTNDSFNPMKFLVDAQYGYYGSSSGYSATSDELGKFLAAAIQEKMPELLDRAVEIAENVAEQKRQDAIQEAEAVLQQAKEQGDD